MAFTLFYHRFAGSGYIKNCGFRRYAKNEEMNLSGAESEFKVVIL